MVLSKIKEKCKKHKKAIAIATGTIGVVVVGAGIGYEIHKHRSSVSGWFEGAINWLSDKTSQSQKVITAANYSVKSTTLMTNNPNSSELISVVQAAESKSEVICNDNCKSSELIKKTIRIPMTIRQMNENRNASPEKKAEAETLGIILKKNQTIVNDYNKTINVKAS